MKYSFMKIHAETHATVNSISWHVSRTKYWLQVTHERVRESNVCNPRPIKNYVSI